MGAEEAATPIPRTASHSRVTRPRRRKAKWPTDERKVSSRTDSCSCAECGGMVVLPGPHGGYVQAVRTEKTSSSPCVRGEGAPRSPPRGEDGVRTACESRFRRRLGGLRLDGRDPGHGGWNPKPVPHRAEAGASRVASAKRSRTTPSAAGRRLAAAGRPREGAGGEPIIADRLRAPRDCRGARHPSSAGVLEVHLKDARSAPERLRVPSSDFPERAGIRSASHITPWIRTEAEG